jgi:hypothetical protein
MTDTPAPVATSPLLELLKTYAPSIGQCLIIVTTFAAGAGTAWITKPAPAKMVISAMDAPKPVPMVAIGDLDAVIAAHCGGVNGKLDTLLERIPAPKVVPLKKTAARSVK